ncbi:MAG: urate hydroxylase PuuD [Myxococcota bacterium]
MDFVEFLLRWFHFLAGITWIGILYYFNFIQTPFLATELGGQARSAMVRGLVPNALWWFRWGAMFTFITGVLIILMRWGSGEPLSSARMTTILTGAAMGTLMWANVWFVIWPAQKLAIASAEAVAAGGEADPAAGAAAPRAGRASRTNTLFSIPLLFMMGAASHYPMGEAATVYWVVALVVIGIMELNALAPSFPLQGPLKTVSGTLNAGFVLTAVLYVLGRMLL